METLTKVIKKVSEEEYLLLESQATFKSEYHAGEIVAMAGTQEDHHKIVSNIGGELYMHIKGSNCSVYYSDVLVKLEKCGRYVYPNVVVFCGAEKEKRNEIDIFLNPWVIIEVLSESTARYDKKDKLECYLTLDSLREYWLFDSLKMHVISYKRVINDDWTIQTNKDINEKIKIGACEIALKDIYAGVAFDTEK